MRLRESFGVDVGYNDPNAASVFIDHHYTIQILVTPPGRIAAKVALNEYLRLYSGALYKLPKEEQSNVWQLMLSVLKRNMLGGEMYDVL
jgi:hypothetical protein